MTWNEAKKYMLIEKECINRDCNRDCANCDIVQDVEDLNNAYDVAINALEKQIPKKPTPIDYEKYIDVIDNARFLRGAYWCPNCKHVVKSGSFCSDCGQKLDWESNEE